MTGKSLTYVEVDVDYCANTYGVAPCEAAIIGSFISGTSLEFNFSGSNNNGFTVSDATLTAGADGSILDATGPDPILRKSGLSIVGATNYLIQIDVERMTARDGGAWQGHVFFVNSGHGESGSFFKSFPETGLERVNDRAVITIDMTTLNSGGNDWITHTNTGIRFDFDNNGSPGTFKIHSIDIGHPASSSEATGTNKCFNTLKTCQDRVNFVNAPVTIRFAQDCDYLPTDIPAIPSIGGVSFSPATISLGKDLGQRATLNVKFRDHRHSDTGQGFDKYYAERSYNPFEQGSFWGKWRARQPFLKGRAIRLIRGFVGQTLAEMDTRHYIIESFDGPTPGGEYSLIAKDVLKLADGDRAQAPMVSNGFLVAAINSTDLSLTLSPAGIGAAEYPASGYVAIGGSEIMSYTRSGDVLTIVRAQLGTTASAHEVQDRVQLCLRYVGQDPADIIYDLFTTYALVPAANIILNDWRNETASFLQRLYGATIADPTDVNTLVSELVEQAALAIWWDDVNETINLKVLRAISVDAFTFDDDNTLEGSLQVSEQPNLRASQIWTYYGQRNPLRPIDEPDNFRSTLATVNLQAETDEGQAAILKIFSRWIPAFGRDTAERLNDIQLGRFQVPPRRFTFEVFRDSVDDPVLGGGYQVGNWSIQDAFGAPALAPIQITRLNPTAEKFTVEAEEMLFEALDPADLIDRTIIIDSNINNVNLRTIHDGIFPVPVAFESPSITVTCIIESGVIIGSADTATPSFDIGTWPGGVVIHLENNGEIRGAGGAGGLGGNKDGSNSGPTLDGHTGGAALYTRYPITYEDAGAITYGGGGGGGGGSIRGGGGGGGAGVVPGLGGQVTTSEQSPTDGNPGTQDAGGVGGDGGGSLDLDGGDGGSPGVAGGDGQDVVGDPGGIGGTAGAAIDGISFVTQVGAVGSRLGGQVN